MSPAATFRLTLMTLCGGIATAYGYSYSIDFVNAYGFAAYLLLGEVFVAAKAATWPEWEAMGLLG